MMTLEEEFDALRLRVENEPYWVEERADMPTDNEWQRAKQCWIQLRELGMWHTYPAPDSGVIMGWLKGGSRLEVWVGDDEEGDLFSFSGPDPTNPWRRIEWPEVLEIAAEWGAWYLNKTADSNEPS